MPSARSFVLLVAILGLAAPVMLAQVEGTHSANNLEDQVTQLERDWLAADAKGDADSLRRMISDKFIGSSFEGQLLNKQDIIPDDNKPGGFAGATPGDTHVQVFGDTGVLIGVINTTSGPKPGQIHVTLVCQKSAKGWQIIAAQLTH
jgi:ketosteroid isomerase-like protein